MFVSVASQPAIVYDDPVVYRLSVHYSGFNLGSRQQIVDICFQDVSRARPRFRRNMTFTCIFVLSLFWKE